MTSVVPPWQTTLKAAAQWWGEHVIFWKEFVFCLYNVSRTLTVISSDPAVVFDSVSSGDRSKWGRTLKTQFNEARLESKAAVIVAMKAIIQKVYFSYMTIFSLDIILSCNLALGICFHLRFSSQISSNCLKWVPSDCFHPPPPFHITAPFFDAAATIQLLLHLITFLVLTAGS